jgi:uncharacterized protein YndB with AHSA1/START domain
MRIESSVTAISWIPSEAIQGMPALPFNLGIGHYDEPPPDRVTELDLPQLRDDDRFREANFLKAWIEVEDGRVVRHGNEGRGLVGSTKFNFGPKDIIVRGVAFETLQPEPKVKENEVTFVQTVGGRAGFPAPRRVRRKPFFRITSATAWTTLGLTIRADGSSEHELLGASPFPRHWVYDRDGQLVQKAGTIDFKQWYRESHGENTPWGEEESDAFVTQAESALERQISRDLMVEKGATKRRKLDVDDTLVEQGDCRSRPRRCSRRARCRRGRKAHCHTARPNPRSNCGHSGRCRGSPGAGGARKRAEPRNGDAVIRIDFSVEIDRPPSEVFEYLTDAEKVPEWQSSAIEVRWEGEKAVGARINEVRKFLGRRIESEVEVTAYEPPRRFALKSSSGPVPFSAEHVLSPVNGGTKIDFGAEAEPGGFFKLGEGIVRRTAERQFKGDFETLKDLLEAGGA